MEPSSPLFHHCLAALCKSPFFATLDDDVQREILSLFKYEPPCEADTVISSPGNNPDQKFYVIVSGRAKVSVYHGETGREHILYLLGPGDGFDVISLLDGDPHDVTVTALEKMEILTTPLPQVRTWLLQHPDFNRKFLPFLGEQMRLLSDQVEDLSLYNTETRFARLILQHITSNAPVHGLRLINDLSQETLASMIGSVRVVVAKQIQRWKKQKILSGERGHWNVEDISALLKKAEGKYSSYFDEV